MSVVNRGLTQAPESGEAVSLIHRFGNGDRQAGEQLETVVRNLLSRRIRRCDISAQEAEELVQESIMHVFSRLGEYSEEKGSFEAWICGFAMNSVRTYRRREARVRNNSVVVDDTFDLAYEINPHDADQELVRDAVSSLDLLDQELLHMRFSLGMSSEEIADRSDLNPPQVRKRISRAMERLRRHPAVRQVIQ